MVKRHWVECLTGNKHVLVNDNDQKVVATLERGEQLEPDQEPQSWLWEWVERKHVYVGLDAAKNAAERHA